MAACNLIGTSVGAGSRAANAISIRERQDSSCAAKESGVSGSAVILGDMFAIRRPPVNGPSVVCGFSVDVGCAQFGIPPTAAHGHQELDRVLVTLSLCPDIAQSCLLILALCIQQVQKSGAALSVADTLQTHGFRSHVEGALLRCQKARIVGQSLHNIGNLPKGR